MITFKALPSVNAFLNTVSIVLAASGYYFIQRKKMMAHRACMLSAVATSILFIISYLVYHHFAGMSHFQKTGWIRTAYFSILSSHTLLAAIIVPLIYVTLRRASAGEFIRHRKIARWTLPLWLYVSATGVLIYFMLYG